jgi:predicted ATP-dependent endonuclease of OLD family
MIYQKFEIKNFQGIGSLEIDLSNNRIVTLVGLNESGKTTILQAILLFYKLLHGNEPDERQLNKFRPKGIEFSGDVEIYGELYFEDHDLERIQNKWHEHNPDVDLSIPRTFSFKYVFNYELHAYKGTNRTCIFQAMIDGTDKLLCFENEHQWQELITFIKSELVPEIIFYDDFIYEFPEHIQFTINQTPQQAKANPKNEKWQLVMDDLLKSANPQLSFQEHVVNLWATDNDLAENRISQIERELNKKITHAWRSLFNNGIKKRNFKEIQLRCNFQTNILTISFLIKTETDEVYLISERSKGFRWYFAFLISTEFRKNRAKNILFLLDEPASYLHPSAQVKVLEAIEGLSENAFVIYTTHSHHMINPNWLSSTYVVVDELLLDDEAGQEGVLKEKAKIQAIKYNKYINSDAALNNASSHWAISDALKIKSTGSISNINDKTANPLSSLTQKLFMKN